MTHKEAGACACLSACQRVCAVTNIGGKDSVKGNRQGSLSRPITRRSDQNRKIKCWFLFCDFACLFMLSAGRCVGIVPLRMGAMNRCRGRRPRRPRMTAAPRRGRRPRRPTSCHSTPVTASLAWESVSLQEKNGLPRRCAPRSKCPWGTPRNDRLFRSPETDAGRPLFVNLQNPTTKTEEDVV